MLSFLNRSAASSSELRNNACPMECLALWSLSIKILTPIERWSGEGGVVFHPIGSIWPGTEMLSMLFHSLGRCLCACCEMVLPDCTRDSRVAEYLFFGYLLLSKFQLAKPVRSLVWCYGLSYAAKLCPLSPFYHASLPAAGIERLAFACATHTPHAPTATNSSQTWL